MEGEGRGLACVVNGDGVDRGSDDNPWLLDEAPLPCADQPFVKHDFVPSSADGAEAGKRD